METARGSLDRRSRAVMSTSDVEAAEAFEYWRDVICRTFVELAAEPTTDRFSGTVDHVSLGDIEMTSVRASSHNVTRTRGSIARSGEEFILASIQVRGSGLVEQDGRIARLSDGDMTFYDTTRPYRLSFDEPFEQLVIQAPRETLVRAWGLGSDSCAMTARTLGRHGPGQVVTSFFKSLAKARREGAPEWTNMLQPQALSLLATAAITAAGRPVTRPKAAESNGALVRRYVRQNFLEPSLSVESVARGCAMSRRTVFRALADQPGGFLGLLRHTRVEHAKSLLLADRTRSVAAIAAAAGFATEASFYRAFREVTGLSPGAFRRSSQIGAF